MCSKEAEDEECHGEGPKTSNVPRASSAPRFSVKATIVPLGRLGEGETGTQRARVYTLA